MCAILCGVIAFSLISCEKEKNIEVSSVSIGQTSAEMFEGETIQLNATVLPKDATDNTISWTSSKLSVATVSSSGLVTAVAEGSSTITASAGGKSGTCIITVSKKIVEVSSIELDKTEVSLVEEEAITLTATVKPDDATDKTVTWTTSASDIALVDNGKVTAIAPGEAIITVASGGKSATCKVTVSQKVIPVESVQLDKETLELTEGESASLNVIIAPDNATDKKTTWSSSEPSVASVENGIVHALKEGNANIIAQVSDISAICAVSVKKKLIPTESIELDQTFVALLKNESVTLNPTIRPENATDEISWSTDTPGIVSIDNGVIKAIGDGTGKVYVHSGQYTAACEVAVVSNSSDAIDLGVSVKWASRNIGANLPYESGSYYAWGETSSKNNYSWDTYAWGNGGNMNLTKYVSDAAYGQVDYRSMLARDDDAANKEKGDLWRLPTKEELEELHNRAVWTLAELDGKTGYVVTNKSSGACIFIPLAGQKSGSDTPNVGSNGCYWSSNYKFTSPIMAWYIWLPDYSVQAITVQENYRYVGFPIRPVYGEFPHIDVESISIDKVEISLVVGDSETLTATILPIDASEQEVSWSSSDNTVATVDGGVVKAIAKGTTSINASIGGKQATCSVTVKAPIPSGAVDLGLSVYWASCNIGASTPEEYGDYYAFGETETKEKYYWDTYKWGNKTYPTKFSKYYASDIFPPGTVGEQGAVMDGKTVLDLEDDVAHVKLGGKWRMPTREELLELKTCSWAFTTSNGVPGVQVLNINTGEFIFLPAAGQKVNTILKDEGTRGKYMSSNVSTDSVYEEWILDIYIPSSYRDVTYTSTARCAGYSVRAVCDKE